MNRLLVVTVLTALVFLGALSSINGSKSTGKLRFNDSDSDSDSGSGKNAKSSGNWTKEIKVNDEVRSHIGKLYSVIVSRLEGCEIEAIKPLTFRTSGKFYLCRTEIELLDDWEDDMNAHIKYELSSSNVTLVAIDNRVSEYSKLKDISKDRIETCDDEDD